MTEVIIHESGTMQFIYDDDLRSLFEVGVSSITRASHVEPVDSMWGCDLTPYGGPIVGPFRLREMALSFERDWLRGRMESNSAHSPASSPT